MSRSTTEESKNQEFARKLMVPHGIWSQGTIRPVCGMVRFGTVRELHWLMMRELSTQSLTRSVLAPETRSFPRKKVYVPDTLD